MKKKHTTKLTILFALLVITTAFYSCKKKEEEKKEDTKIEEAVSEPFFKISLAQWSFHKAINDKTMNPLDFAQKAKEMGIDGIEYVNHLYKNQIDSIGLDAVLKILKEKSEQHNVKNLIIMIDGEGDLSSDNEEIQNKAVENHKKWVDAAAYLGCHSIRVNTFGTHDPEKWVQTTEQGLKKLCAYAATKNINVLMENHGWLSSDADKVAQVMKAVNMENCGTLPDFGNWCIKRKDGENWGECIEEYPDMYDGIKKMMPFAKAVSAKSHDFGSDGNETKIDYKKMLQIVKDAGYKGYIGIEYEGSRLSEEEGIIATRDLLAKLSKELN